MILALEGASLVVLRVNATEKMEFRMLVEGANVGKNVGFRIQTQIVTHPDLSETDYQRAEGSEHNSGSFAGDVDAQTWGIRFERRCQHRPITWYVGYEETEVTGRDGSFDHVEIDYLVSGFSIGLGATNLKEQERRGAGGTMPNVGEWVAWTIESVD